ncbi:MAG: hypothetical protein JW850_01325 [Thermoflexales bacterium]|nr:hypothetical protein [Thermoflexales bacterium]
MKDHAYLRDKVLDLVRIAAISRILTLSLKLCGAIVGLCLSMAACTLPVNPQLAPAGTPAGFNSAPTRTPEPLIPTLRPSDTPTSTPQLATRVPGVTPFLNGTTPAASATPTPAASATPAPVASATPVQEEATAQPVLMSPRPRFGAGVPSGQLSTQIAGRLGLSWYLTWDAYTRDAPAGIEFWPMVRPVQIGLEPDAAALTRLAAARPGATWTVGNEPDVKWQDNLSPQQYAMFYHQVYTLIKAADPTARLAPAAISQPTELRLRYLDQVLDSYRQLYGQPLPADVWTIHAYILNEQRNSWGTDIPPGFSEDGGELVDIEQHDDMNIFRQRILRFRQWMARQGYRDRELAVTEYGLLMPEDYGFDPERVRRFMWATFDYFQTAADAQVGLPSDGNRLVQRWAWFSVSDELYPAGNLVDPASGQLTPAGQAFAEYVAGLH